MDRTDLFQHNTNSSVKSKSKDFSATDQQHGWMGWKLRQKRPRWRPKKANCGNQTKKSDKSKKEKKTPQDHVFQPNESGDHEKTKEHIINQVKQNCPNGHETGKAPEDRVEHDFEPEKLKLGKPETSEGDNEMNKIMFQKEIKQKEHAHIKQKKSKCFARGTMLHSFVRKNQGKK